MVFSVERLVADIDTLALIEFSESTNRRVYIQQHCRDMYGNVSPAIHAMAAKAFVQAADNMPEISRKPRKDRGVRGSLHF